MQRWILKIIALKNTIKPPAQHFICCKPGNAFSGTIEADNFTFRIQCHHTGGDAFKNMGHIAILLHQRLGNIGMVCGHRLSREFVFFNLLIL